MKASEIQSWPDSFSPSEWPDGVLEWTTADLLLFGLFPLRKRLGESMSPSSLFGAHVRHDGSNSQHSTKNKTRYSRAGDFYLKTRASMIKAMYIAESLPEIGGIGIYFDTNNPLIHIDEMDGRNSRLVWLCPARKDGEEREYIYRENDPVYFYCRLADELACSGSL